MLKPNSEYIHFAKCDRCKKYGKMVSFDDNCAHNRTIMTEYYCQECTTKIEQNNK